MGPDEDDLLAVDEQQVAQEQEQAQAQAQEEEEKKSSNPYAAENFPS